MSRHTGIASLSRAAALSMAAAFVILPLLATFLGGFKTIGELRSSPFGLPPTWHTEYYIGILTKPVFSSCLKS